jgi:hypothetical protein
VVSLNILNQLDILIVDYLRRYITCDDAEILSLRKKIQSSHVDSLPRDRSCLITDYEEWTYAQDQLVSKKPLVHIPLPEGKKKTSWTWQFDLHKTYHKGKTTHFHVIAQEC